MQLRTGGVVCSVIRRGQRVSILALSVVWLNLGVYAAPPKWQPVTAAELAIATPVIDPEAPAEILFQETELDHSDFPASVVKRDYIRIKIFKPEQIENITRISGREVTGAGINNRSFSVRARLTSPQGNSQEFGNESLRERTISQKGERNLLDRLLGVGRSQEKEKFLAISGAEAGSILEFRIELKQQRRSRYEDLYTALLQRPRIPVREVNVRVKLPPADEWGHNCFLMNSKVGSPKLSRDEKVTVLTLQANNVPALAEESLSGPTHFYHGLTLVLCYQKTRVVFQPWNPGRSFRTNPKEDGPWSTVAIRDFALVDDRSKSTKRVQQLAAELAKDATEPAARAERIHARISALHERWVQLRKKKEGRTEQTFTSLDQILDVETKNRVGPAIPHDFTSLSLALFRAAGLEAQAVLLPDRRRVPLQRGYVSRSFMPHLAVAVKIGNHWRFSIPTLRPSLPFGDLPWYCEGEAALVLKDGKEEFLPVPHSQGNKSLTGNGGNFTLEGDGTLVGNGRRRYTGQAAYIIRQKLLDKSEEQQKNILAQQLSSDLRTELISAEEEEAEDDDGNEGEAAAVAAVDGLTVTNITGLSENQQPLDIDYTLRINGYAAVGGGRIVVRPWIFRTKSANPFSGDSRRTRIYFPYAWQELDVVNLTLPPGYAPQLSENQLPPSSESLYYNCSLKYDAQQGQLRGRREFASNIVRAEPDAFVTLKSLYENLTQYDLQEVVLTKVAPGNTASLE